MNWLIDFNFVYQGIQLRCSFWKYATYLPHGHYYNLVLVHAGYLLCKWHSLNTLQGHHYNNLVFTHAGYLLCNWQYLTPNITKPPLVESGMPESFNSSQIIYHLEMYSPLASCSDIQQTYSSGPTGRSPRIRTLSKVY